MAPIDDLDRRILIELQEDGRRSYREIAKRVGVTAGTVRTRMLQMTESGLLSVVGLPNLYEMGFKFHALVGIKVAPGRALEVAQLLEPSEDITWVGLTATGYDLLVEIAMRDAQEFGRYKEEVLAQLPGFVSADVFVYWHLLKLFHRFEAIPAHPTRAADRTRHGGSEEPAPGNKPAAPQRRSESTARGRTSPKRKGHQASQLAPHSPESPHAKSRGE
jgi:Lrp/AsnC family transcriptional regulator, regulator for asnA, asnC and gidA